MVNECKSGMSRTSDLLDKLIRPQQYTQDVGLLCCAVDRYSCSVLSVTMRCLSGAYCESDDSLWRVLSERKEALFCCPSVTDVQ